MTLPASGAISIVDIENEAGGGAPYSADLEFLNNKITPGQVAGAGTGGTGVAMDSQRPATPNFAGFYGLSYYQSTQNGNCNNTNCTEAASSGTDKQCVNCRNSTINCANCDSQAWLQSGANCACTYNCDSNQVTYNCNCTCACFVCACACW